MWSAGLDLLRASLTEQLQKKTHSKMSAHGILLTLAVRAHTRNSRAEVNAREGSTPCAVLQNGTLSEEIDRLSAAGRRLSSHQVLDIFRQVCATGINQVFDIEPGHLQWLCLGFSCSSSAAQQCFQPASQLVPLPHAVSACGHGRSLSATQPAFRCAQLPTSVFCA